jgi:UPF0755 protein
VSEMSLSEVLPGAFPPEPPPKRGRGAARAQRKRKKRRRRRAILVILLTMTLVGGAVVGSYLGLAPLIRQLNEPKDYVGGGTGTVQVKIPSGASGRTISQVLASAGVVKTQVAFLDAAKKNPRSTGVQPGTYAMRLKMSGAAALGVLLDPKARLVLTVTIPEGTRVKDELNLMAKNLGLKPADLQKASTSEAIGLPAAAKGRPEGFLFPATYNFQPDVTATEALKAMVDRGKQAFGALGIPDSALRSTVIEASIVQAEAGNKQYMGKVATVLNNRLKAKRKLELDSTVSYATGHFGITTSTGDRATVSPYNTYRVYGLPAGPIDNPGEDALEAVLKPTPGPWLYFVTVNPNTGETKFAVDEAGHAANRKEFQAWLRAHPSGK